MEYSEDAISEIKCRVCFESHGKIISPCLCRGSVKYIHEECMNKWIYNLLHINQGSLKHRKGK